MLGLGLGVVQVLWYSTVRLIKMGNSKVKVGYTSFALLWSCVLFCCHQKQIKAIWIQNMCKESLGNFMFLYVLMAKVYFLREWKQGFGCDPLTSEGDTWHMDQ